MESGPWMMFSPIVRYPLNSAEFRTDPRSWCVIAPAPAMWLVQLLARHHSCGFHWTGGIPLAARSELAPLKAAAVTGSGGPAGPLQDGDGAGAGPKQAVAEIPSTAAATSTCTAFFR